MSSREAILNRIKDALKTPSEICTAEDGIERKIKIGIDSITPKDKAGLWSQFEKELIAISGEFYSVKNVDGVAEIVSKFLNEAKYRRLGISKEEICSDVAKIIQKKSGAVEIVLPDVLTYERRKREYSITEASVVHPAFAVADIGSLVFPYAQTGTTYPHFLCDNAFAVVFQNQIVANQFELFEKMDPAETKNMVFITGPSRTADIEKVLVLGAHGPRKLVVLKIEE